MANDRRFLTKILTKILVGDSAAIPVAIPVAVNRVFGCCATDDRDRGRAV